MISACRPQKTAMAARTSGTGIITTMKRPMMAPHQPRPEANQRAQNHSEARATKASR